MAPKLTEKERNRQMKKEAIISIAMYVGFFVWWYFTGYGIAEKGTPDTYTYVLGLPMWFFLSSIVGYVLFSIATILVVRLCFKNFDLGPAADEEQEDTSLLDEASETKTEECQKGGKF